MPHINIPSKSPGIIGLMQLRRETAEPLNQLAEVLLRGPSSLGRGEREAIAALVSRLNDCEFCCSSHAAFAALQIEGGRAKVGQILSNYETARVSEKLKALFRIASQVQRGGKHVTSAAVADAKQLGATDTEIHDTVLIAAAFCMYNRYVDGLGTLPPADPSAYDDMAERIVERGYRNAIAYDGEGGSS
jgi:uncharacterized peroxidase-related enzyme